ncbi:hypothetical protein [uncultured Clostridium sp.]|uniref:hypothetical protein n=1 Tax=uncultured Clostridium sp. TaxID=59620 RepID=UPI00259060A8|nr:hypothetical protein [uncultured Clostridium sp.]
MRIKKASIVFSVVIIVLLLLIGLIVSNILNRGTKEVKIAKNFISDLYDSGVIEENKEIKNEVVKEEALNKASNENSKIKYSVIVGDYAVSIDKDYNILGFLNKSIEDANTRSNYIKEDDAIYLAKSYLSKITKDDCKFKEIRVQEGVASPVYNIIFYKYRDGYPYYTQEINTLINKITGKLEGYTNYPINDMKYIEKINIDEEEATNILKDNFKRLKLDITLVEEPMLGYVNISDKEMVLAYIFNIKINNDNKEENKKDTCISLVRADTGEIVNYNLEAVARK